MITISRERGRALLRLALLIAMAIVCFPLNEFALKLAILFAPPTISGLALMSGILLAFTATFAVAGFVALSMALGIWDEN